MLFLELIYEFWINYVFYEENIKFGELNNFYCVQHSIVGGKLHLLDLWMKYQKGGASTQKQ